MAHSVMAVDMAVWLSSHMPVGPGLRGTAPFCSRVLGSREPEQRETIKAADSNVN
jgi:hypothetical protein